MEVEIDNKHRIPLNGELKNEKEVMVLINHVPYVFKVVKEHVVIDEDYLGYKLDETDKIEIYKKQ
jgi:hypothetical protein